jgi:hypothetical protein
MSSAAKTAKGIRVMDPQECLSLLRSEDIALGSCSCLKGYLRTGGFAGKA